MKTIETTGTVERNGLLSVPVPTDIPVGEHHVVVMIDTPVQSNGKRSAVAASLKGAGCKYLRPEADPVGSLIREREREG